MPETTDDNHNCISEGNKEVRERYRFVETADKNILVKVSGEPSAALRDEFKTFGKSIDILEREVLRTEEAKF